MTLCECGCGQVTSVAFETGNGYRRGEPKRFISGHNSRTKSIKPGSYRSQKVADGATRLVHVLIAERALGRSMPVGAEVHHADGNSHNNSNGNLVICQDRAYHQLLHVRMRVKAAGGNPDTDKWCCTCKQTKHKSRFYRLTASTDGLAPACSECQKKAQRKGRRMTRQAKKAGTA